MKFRSIKYYFREGFSSMIRNRLMSIASIATVSACIFIIAFSFCVVSNLRYMLTQIEDSIGVAVFLEDDLSGEEITGINDKIKAIDHVKEVVYISPDDALEELKKEWKEDDVLAGFNAENNPLSNSFEISVDAAKYQKDVLASLDNIEGVRKVRHAQSETDALLKANKVVSVIGIVVIAILGVISVVIIMNTIKISVYTRRNEINIMKFVGATDWFIRWPFIIEGVLIGLIGATIPMIVAWPAYNKVVELIYLNLPVIKNMVSFKFGIDIFSVLLPVSLASGVMLGIIGSMSSIRKHLKV